MNKENSLERSAGTTASERYLVKLAEKTFLDLWYYPNLYIDKKVNRVGHGKELCDLLVVCGDHILIFSVKYIEWPDTKDIDVAWCRWYKRAIKKSADQVCGAERWITEFPERVFLDRECFRPFPLKLPLAETRKVHGIVIAHGAGEACRRYFGGGSGSLVVRTDLRGDDHVNPGSALYAPFNIGDVNPGGSFIHVMDDTTLEILMSELDTISDFTEYLDKKAKFLRSGRLAIAEGEEDLLADYLIHTNAEGEHDFLRPDGKPWEEHDAIAYPGGLYIQMRSDRRYRRKKEADRISYVWDRLIQAFTSHMIDGTTLVPDGGEFELGEQERGVRYMALENRLQRRLHSQAIMGVIDIVTDSIEKGKYVPRFVRAMVPSPSDNQNGTGFFFLLLTYPKHLEGKGGYEQYRVVRRRMLEAYALGFMNRFRHLDRIVGIATEPPAAATGQPGSSEDLILFEPEEWTQDLSEDAARICKEYNILQGNAQDEYHVHGDEYPETSIVNDPSDQPPPTQSQMPSLNRHQRRAEIAKNRRKSRKRNSRTNT